MSETTKVARGADPVTTEIVRQALNAAAEQMKRALIRTVLQPRHLRGPGLRGRALRPRRSLLAQAPTLPTFMGTMSFCVNGAVEAVGGEAALEPGDIILYNVPYGTGSHPQDVAVVMPVFLAEGELIGYSAIKAHGLDIGGKDPYSTDTVDVFQEGTIFPGVKLYPPATGQRHLPDGHRELPRPEAGRGRHQRPGRRRAGRRHRARPSSSATAAGLPRVRRAHVRGGRGVVRSWFEQLPDGRYLGRGEMDSDGLTEDAVPFEIAIDIDGSNVTVDYTTRPRAPRARSTARCRHRLRHAHRHHDARRRRRGAQRGALPRDRGR